MYCKNCGNELATRNKFCGKCGEKIISNMKRNKTTKTRNLFIILISMLCLAIFIPGTIFAVGSLTKQFKYAKIAKSLESTNPALAIEYAKKSVDSGGSDDLLLKLQSNETADPTKITKKSQVNPQVKSQVNPQVKTQVNPQVKTQENPSNTPKNGYRDILDFDTKLLKTSDLSALPKKDYEFIRNEIFARHGQMFNNPKFSNYFKQFSWYIPMNTNNRIVLNSIEKANVEFLLKLE